MSTPTTPESGAGEAPPSTGSGWVRLVVVALLALAVGAAGGLVAGSQVAGPKAPATPGEGSADAGFARDMQAHHAQAVEMSTIVRKRTNDAEVRTIALDIALTQQQQIGQMYAWLQAWGLPQSSTGPRMAWMDGGDHGQMPGGGKLPKAGEAMPGMATPEQLRKLSQREGRAAEVLFLRLMIEHHRAGVVMAEHAVNKADKAVVRRLAQKMVDAQESEISAMRAMLEARNAGDSG